MLTMTFAGPAGSLGNYLQGLAGTPNIMALQTALNAAGFNTGTPDGVAGPKTAAAIIDFVIKAASVAAQFTQVVSQIPSEVQPALNALLATDTWLRTNTNKIPLVGSIGLSTAIRNKTAILAALNLAKPIGGTVGSIASTAIGYINTVMSKMNTLVNDHASHLTQAVGFYTSLTGGGGGGGGALPESLPGDSSFPPGTGTVPVAITGLIKKGTIVMRDMRTPVPGGTYQPPAQLPAPAATKYPAGSIARFNTTRGAWTIYAPKGGGLFGYGVYPNLMGLGWMAQFPVSPAPPAGTEQAGQEPTKEDAIAAGATPDNQPEKDRPFYKSPWVIGGAIAVVVAGAGGYVLLRRKRPTTSA